MIDASDAETSRSMALAYAPNVRGTLRPEIDRQCRSCSGTEGLRVWPRA
jgi:hypothetical protein